MRAEDCGAHRDLAPQKELVGDYANGGAEWEPAASPQRVGVHDFPDPEMGKVIPYGVYDIAGNEGQAPHDLPDGGRTHRRHQYETGLTVQADFDEGYYPTGVKVTDAELAAVPIEPHDFHPDWNCTIFPAPP